MTAIGFVGLGNIGASMAGRLPVEDLWVCDLQPEVLQPFIDRGAKAGSLAEVGAHCDVISIVVLTDAQVRRVVTELLETAKPGTVIAIHSTVEAATAPELARIALASGVHVVDAPVSGGPMGAPAGRLAVMLGGSEEAFKLAEPVLRHWAELVLHVGEAGVATRFKVARNLITYVGYAAASEASRLAEAAGIDLQQLAAVTRHSDAITGGASAIMIRRETGRLDDSDPLREIFGHAVELADKDLALALALGEELRVDLPLAAQARKSLPADLGQ